MTDEMLGGVLIERCLWQRDDEDECWWIECAPGQPLGFEEIQISECIAYCPFCGSRIEWGEIGQEETDG